MIKINLIGTDYHTKLVREILRYDEQIIFEENIDNADLLYVIFGPGIRKSNLRYWLLGNKPILIHWIGVDTFIFNREKKEENLKQKIKKKIILGILKYRYKRGRLKSISSAPWLAEEVTKKSGISTDYLVLTSIKKEEILSPKNNRKYDFTSYIPIGRFKLYNGKLFLEAAKNNPNKEFCIVSPDLENEEDWPREKYKNLKIQPRTDKLGFYNVLNDSKYFVRLKDGGDAIALSIMEALAHGCKVIWNLKFKHCYYETRDSFLKNIDKYDIDDFTINYEAIEFIKNNYSTEKWINDFKKILAKLELA